MPAPKTPNTTAAREARSRAARERRHAKMADELRAAGWHCTPPMQERDDATDERSEVDRRNVVWWLQEYAGDAGTDDALYEHTATMAEDQWRIVLTETRRVLQR